MIALWDYKTGQRLRCLDFQSNMPPQPGKKPPNKIPVTSLAFAPDGKTLVAASPDRVIRFWDVQTGMLRRTMVSQADALAFTSDGQTLISSALEKTGVVIRLFSMNSNEERQWRIPLQRPQLLNRSCFVLSPDGKTLVVATGEADRLHWFEVATGKEIVAFQGHELAVRSLAFSADGALLLSGSRDTTTLIWQTLEVWRQSAKPPRQWNEETVRHYWELLGDGDAGKAYQALALLALAPDATVPFLKSRLHPVTDKTRPAIMKLIKDLDDDAFAVREAAVSKIAEYGSAALEPVRQALATASPKATKNLDMTLERIREQILPREERTIQLLEWIGNEEARQLLRTLASGTTDAPSPGRPRLHSTGLSGE